MHCNAMQWQCIYAHAFEIKGGKWCTVKHWCIYAHAFEFKAGKWCIVEHIMIYQ